MTVFVAPVAKASISPPFNNYVISRIPWILRNKSSPLSYCSFSCMVSCVGFEYLSIEMYITYVYNIEDVVV